MFGKMHMETGLVTGTILMYSTYAEDSDDRAGFQGIYDITTITAQFGQGGRYWGFLECGTSTPWVGFASSPPKNAYFVTNVSSTSAPATNIVALHVTSDMKPRQRRTNRIVPDKVARCYSTVLLQYI